MKKIAFSIAASAFALTVSQLAHAQVTLDVSKITCKQFATYDITKPEFIAVWVSGYHHGTRGDTVLDMEQVKANTSKMQEYCIKNPDVPFMTAVETVLGGN
jgi:hypothetical protein